MAQVSKGRCLTVLILADAVAYILPDDEAQLRMEPGIDAVFPAVAIGLTVESLVQLGLAVGGRAVLSGGLTPEVVARDAAEMLLAVPVIVIEQPDREHARGLAEMPSDFIHLPNGHRAHRLSRSSVRMLL